MVGIHLHPDDLGRPHSSSNKHCKKSNGSTPDYRHGFAAEIRDLTGMHGVAKGLLDGSHLGTNSIQVRGPERFSRQFDVLRKAAIPTDANDGVFGTDMRVTHPTLVAASAHDVGLCRNHVTDFQAVLFPSPIAKLDDFSKELVAHHPFVGPLIIEGA
jgi:hypothetical protein